MRRRPDADQDDREPRGDPSKRLSQKHHQRKEGEDQHCLHPGGIRVESLPLPHRVVDEYGRKLAAVDGKHGDGVEGEDQRHALRIAGLDPELGVQIGRGPEEEEPPDSVGHELADSERPGLPVSQALHEPQFLRGSVLGCLIVVKFLVLLDVGQFLLAHVL